MYWTSRAWTPTLVLLFFFFITLASGKISGTALVDKLNPALPIEEEKATGKRTLFNNIPLNIAYRALRTPGIPGLRRKPGQSLDTISGYGLGRNLDGLNYVLYEKPWWMTSQSYPTLTTATEQRLGMDKRNFDMLDTPGFDRFEKRKRNFDMIDSAGFGHWSKRSLDSVKAQKRNFDQIDSPTGFMEFFHFYP